MAVWAKSTGLAVDHDLTVTGFSSGEEKTTASSHDEQDHHDERR